MSSGPTTDSPAAPRFDLPRIRRLPPYVLNEVNELKLAARRRGEDIVDFGMGNPDQPPPQPVIDKLCEVAQRPDTHRYSASRGIPRLRRAITQRYREQFGVELDPDTEVIVTIGSKEGIAHLALATVEPGDAVLVPSPAYPIHSWGFVIAGADIRHVPLTPGEGFFAELEAAIRNSWPPPKLLVTSFPANPTGHCVELDFFERLVSVARQHDMRIVHDFAYADLVFDGYRAPSILEVPGAKDVAVEFYSLSKSFNMPGWRVGFMVGNRELVSALTRIKSYLDYGIFTPVQVASIVALEECSGAVDGIREMYRRRRDVLCEGLSAAGWPVDKPRATMFVWAPIPEQYRHLGALAFAKMLLERARVAVSPGTGFGEYGEGYVRFSLIENEHRTRQAVRAIRAMFREDTRSAAAG